MLSFGNKIFVIIILVSLSIFFYNKNQKSNFQYDEKTLQLLDNREYKFIAHAGGGIDGYTYTNSLEAINLSISKGFKLIEIDLMETKDKYFVGVNNWQKFKRDNLFKENEINDKPLSLKEFKKVKIFTKYTPLTSNEINKIFGENKDLILVTDKTNNFKKINRDFSFNKKRIIVEIFSKRDYFKAIKQDIVNPMLSANSKDYNFIIKNNIKLISAHAQEIIDNKEIYQELINQGVKVFAFTSNDKKFIEENLDSYFSGIYVDFLDMKNIN
jgi:glycerophosphoryl diester phosphodiesterase